MPILLKLLLLLLILSLIYIIFSPLYFCSLDVLILSFMSNKYNFGLQFYRSFLQNCGYLFSLKSLRILSFILPPLIWSISSCCTKALFIESVPKRLRILSLYLAFPTFVIGVIKQTHLTSLSSSITLLSVFQSGELAFRPRVHQINGGNGMNLVVILVGCPAHW